MKRQRNVSETPQTEADTDSDTETEQSRADRPPAALDSEKGKPVSKEARSIAKRLAEMFGGDPESKNWHPSYVDVWLTEGVSEDRIMSVAAEVAERGKDVNSIKYFIPALTDNDESAPAKSDHASTMPPKGMRIANQAEYIAYMREKLSDPKFDQSDYRYSRWQWVPIDWNVTPIRKAG